jgi:hypothetical protein
MGLTLEHVPGFADQQDSALAAGLEALGIEMGKISENANFGMCNVEFFYETHKDGDTVNLQTSPIDGYNYGPDEQLYVWSVANTVQASSSWSSGPGSLWWGNWKVSQFGDVATPDGGAVSCEEFYRNSHSGLDGNSADTRDGVLTVMIICQRRRGLPLPVPPVTVPSPNTGLTMSAAPAFADIADSVFVQDAPLTTGMMTTMNGAAKLGVAKSEVFYMGEFYQGQLVPQPVSPIDGYTYQYYECAFQHSWRFTAGLGGILTVPANSNRQLDDIMASVDGIGNVSVTVDYKDDTNTGVVSTQEGLIAVFAFCRRKLLSFTTVNTTDTETAVSESPVTAFTGKFTNATQAGQPQLFKVVNNLPASQPTIIFKDGSGNVLASHFVNSGTTVSWAVPPGTASVSYTGNSSSHSLVFTLYDGTTPIKFAATANDFSELDLPTFFPGVTLRASNTKQVFHNAKEAIGTAEFFGPTQYSNGQTIPLPTSLIDGYAYARTELFYVFEWALTGTGLQGATDIRIVVAQASISQATGLVSCIIYRLPGGGTFSLTNDGALRVLVCALRARVSPANPAPVNQPPGGQPGGEGLANAMLDIEYTGVALDDSVTIEGVTDGAALTQVGITNVYQYSITIDGTYDGGL